MSSLVYLLVWSPPPHIPYISSPNQSSFHSTCPCHRNLFCCSINIISSIPSLSLNSLLGTLSFTLTLHIHLTAQVPCSNATKIWECKFGGCRVNFAPGKIPQWGKNPRKCIYSVPAQEMAKHRAKFGWLPLSNVAAVTLPRHETRWNLLECLKLPDWSQPLAGRSSPYCEVDWLSRV